MYPNPLHHKRRQICKGTPERPGVTKMVQGRLARATFFGVSRDELIWNELSPGLPWLFPITAEGLIQRHLSSSCTLLILASGDLSCCRETSRLLGASSPSSLTHFGIRLFQTKHSTKKMRSRQLLLHYSPGWHIRSKKTSLRKMNVGSNNDRRHIKFQAWLLEINTLRLGIQMPKKKLVPASDLLPLCSGALECKIRIITVFTSR